MNSKFFKNGFSNLDCNSISNANYQMIGIGNAYMRGKSPITTSIICVSSQVSWFGTIENNRKVRASRCKNYKVHNSQPHNQDGYAKYKPNMKKFKTHRLINKLKKNYQVV